MVPHRWLLAGTLVILSTGAGLLPMAARADAPTVDSIPFDSTFTLTQTCSFPLAGSVVGTAFITDYYDHSGNLTRELDRAPREVATLTGPNGTSITSDSPSPTHFTITSTGFVARVTGLDFNYHLPGYGKLDMMAGNTTVTVDFSTDPPTVTQTFDGLHFSDTSTLCSVLGS